MNDIQNCFHSIQALTGSSIAMRQNDRRYRAAAEAAWDKKVIWPQHFNHFFILAAILAFLSVLFVRFYNKL